MTDQEKRELEALRAENQALKAANQAKLSFKVSEKGAISVYGLGRFPVTLYKEQWITLLDVAPKLRTFVETAPGAKTRDQITEEDRARRVADYEKSKAKVS